MGDDSCAGGKRAPGWQRPPSVPTSRHGTMGEEGSPQGGRPAPQQHPPMPYPGHISMTHASAPLPPTPRREWGVGQAWPLLAGPVVT